MNLNRLKTYWAGCLVAIVIGSVGVSSAAAANLIWTNTTSSGIYSNSGNWNPVLVPGEQAIDATIFTNDTNYTVNFTANATLATNYFNGHAGVVTVDITGSTWNLTNNANGTATAGTSAFVVGQGLNTTATVYLAGGTLAVTNTLGGANLTVGGLGSGTFIVTNGTVIANTTKLGQTATGKGVLVLSGNGTYYTNSSTLIIGRVAGSSGSLIISNSASLTTVGAITVGASGSGGNTVVIGNNGTIVSLGGGTIGLGSSNNAVTVLAGGTWQSAGILSFGSAGGTGNTMTVLGNLVTVQSYIGNSTTNNSVSVLAGGYWKATSTFNIGMGGGVSNTLMVNGGVVSNASASVGATGGASFNEVVVTNGGQIFSSAGWTIGNSSGANGNNIRILDNALVNIGNQRITIGAESNTTGNWVRVDGGTLTNVGQNSANPFGNGLYIGGVSSTGLNAFSNTLLIANTGKVFLNPAASFNPIWIGFQTGANNNSITLLNGGQLFGGNVYVGGTNAYNNAYNVGGGVTRSTASNSAITVGYFSGGNTLTVTNADLLSGTTIIGNGGSNNTATILANGNWKLLAAPLTIGNGAATGNTLRVFGGTVTNITTLTVNAANTLTLGDAGAVYATTITVNGDLRGTGTLGGNVTIAAGGTLSPGFSTGTLTFNNDLTLTGTAAMELSSGGNLGGADKFLVLGALSGDGLVRVTTNGTFTIAAGDKWDLFDWSAGTPTFTFDGSAVALPGGLEWDITQLNIDGTITVIPEPATLVLVAGGLALVALQRQRRRANRPGI
ncbi:MAG: hypothetical protein PCFJNLEI_02578 [Verrucomicrobiae bacterium]|nr:hypothetical protein [Verrucomicrobiae bacterium]